MVAVLHWATQTEGVGHADLVKAEVNGIVINFEAESFYGTELTTSARDVVERAGDALQYARETIIGLASSMAESIRGLEAEARPEEFTLEFALKFSAEGSAIVAKAGTEANLKVSLKYVGNH